MRDFDDPWRYGRFDRQRERGLEEYISRAVSEGVRREMNEYHYHMKNELMHHVRREVILHIDPSDIPTDNGQSVKKNDKKPKTSKLLLLI